MKTCFDCKENDRSFSTNMNYRCSNDWCEWYVGDYASRPQVQPCEPQLKVKQKLKRHINQFFKTDYTIKNRSRINSA